MVYKYSILAVLVLFVLLGGCSNFSHPPQPIVDLQKLPQSPLFYLQYETADAQLIEPQHQEFLRQSFLAKYFSPWHQNGYFWPAEEAFRFIAVMHKRAVFAENLRPWPLEKLNALSVAAKSATVPKNGDLAITLRNSNLRLLPSNKPFFFNPQLAGEGFPFDNLQNSAILANTPVKIRLVTADGRWFYVENALTFGWLEASDVATVDTEFIEHFETGRYLAVSQDDVSIYDSEGNYQTTTRIGALYPLLSTTKEQHEITLAAAGVHGRAVVRSAYIATEKGDLFPRPLTLRNIALHADQMAGEPYGWGGLFFNRDCSRSIRDIMVPFGIWLPRNSSEQAAHGEPIALVGLSAVEKEQMVIDQATPFLSILWLPGHVMLYLGQYEGRVIVLHTLWGLKTQNLWGEGGREVIGSTIITTLEPGKELANLARPKGNLLYRIEKMIQIVPITPNSSRNKFGSE